jgi:hypothetical protein
VGERGRRERFEIADAARMSMSIPLETLRAFGT